MSAQELTNLNDARMVSPGDEYLWIGMFHRNIHTRLYDGGYRTFGCIAVKTEAELIQEGFDEHETAELGRALAVRQLSFASEPDISPDTTLNVVSRVVPGASQITTNAVAPVVTIMPERLDVAS